MSALYYLAACTPIVAAAVMFAWPALTRWSERKVAGHVDAALGPRVPAPRVPDLEGNPDFWNSQGKSALR